MPDEDPQRTFSLETLRRMDREVVHLNLGDDDARALLPLLRDLFALIDRIGPGDRAADPEITVNMERWDS